MFFAEISVASSAESPKDLRRFPSLHTRLNFPELATFAFGERVNSNANSPSQRSLAKEAASAQPFEVFRQRVLRTVATTRLHIRATSSYLVGAGPDRRRLRASSKARNWHG